LNIKNPIIEIGVLIYARPESDMRDENNLYALKT